MFTKSDHVAGLAAQGRIQYRRTSDDHIEATFYICHAQALAFSPDGKLFAAAGGQNGSQAKIKVWRVADRQQLCEIITAGGGALVLALSQDGSLIVAAGSGGRAKTVRFSADDKSVLVRSADGTESSFNPADGRGLRAER